MSRTPGMRFSTAFCVAIYMLGSAGPARAAVTNVATLSINGTIASNCIVQTQPATLSMTYDTVQNLGTMGTSVFQYACTKAGTITVTPTSPNDAGGSKWEAVNGTNDLLYLLYNSPACTTKQLKNGTAESLAAGTGLGQTYNICAIPRTTTDQKVPAGTYTDTVTFTLDFGP